MLIILAPYFYLYVIQFDIVPINVLAILSKQLKFEILTINVLAILSKQLKFGKFTIFRKIKDCDITI